MCVGRAKNNFKYGSLPRGQVLFLGVIIGFLKEMLVLDRDKKIGQSFSYKGLKEGTFIIGGEKEVSRLAVKQERLGKFTDGPDNL